MKNKGFQPPNIWVITLKNEGCGFPWYRLDDLEILTLLKRCLLGTSWDEIAPTGSDKWSD